MPSHKWFDLLRCKLQPTTILKDDSGVALIAIAFVLGSIALATTVAIIQRESGIQEELRDTRSQRTNFDLIKAALEVYALQDYGASGVASGGDLYRLPCPANPADGDGVREAWDSDNACGSNNRGIVPWSSIGLSESDVIDGEGNYITYIVHSTDSMEVCDGLTALAGNLDDANATANSKYALISHGTNTFGGFRAVTNAQASAPSSSNEQANCSVSCGAGTSTNVFRSGPSSNDSSTFFDDVVRGVQLGTKITSYCKELFGEEAVSAGTSGSREVLVRLVTRTQNNSTAQLNQPSVNELDPDGTADTGDELVGLRFQNNDTFASSACAHSEVTFPLQGHVIRVYGQIAFKSDIAGTDQGSGNGLVFGFAGHKQTDDNAATTVSNTDCGGVDQYMGFQDDGAGHALATNIERFGIEIDTYRHLAASGPYSAGDIFDPTANHIAIVTGDVDHEGSETIAEGEEDNSPICRDLDALGFSEFGIAPEDRGNGDWPTVAAGKRVDTTATNEGDGEACIRNSSDPDWLEDGDPFRDGVTDQFHDFRIELHDYSVDGDDLCDANEIRIDAWIWGNNDSDNNCDTEPCNDITSNFDNGTSGREPHVRLCIDDNTSTGEADLQAVRYFLANGSPVRASSAAQRNDLYFADFRLGFERVDGASNKTDGGDDNATTVITEDDIRQYLNLTTGNITTNQGFARRTTNGVNIFSDEGALYLDELDGLGVAGVGNSNNLLDTIDPSNTSAYPNANGSYLDVNDREKIVFEFDNEWACFTVNIRDFGDSDNGGYTGSDIERVLLRAFNGTTMIGEEINVQTCSFNAGNAGTAHAMAITTDFNMDVTAGERFDRVQIIPIPIDSSDPEAHTRILVGAAVACGQNRHCGFDRTDSSDNTLNYSEFRCHQVLSDPPNATGLNETDEIQPEAVNSLMGLGDNVNEDVGRSWIDLNNYPEDGSDLDVQIFSENGTLRSQDNSGETTVGFGVNGTGTSSSLLDTLDTVLTPTGSETNVEQLQFKFEQDWPRLLIGITRFGTQANGGSDQVQVAFYNDGNATAINTQTISPCPGADTNNNWRKDVLIDIDSLTSGVFDEVRVTPLPNTGSGDRQTQVYVRSLKACDLTDPCDLAYGDENVGQASRYCTETIQ